MHNAISENYPFPTFKLSLIGEYEMASVRHLACVFGVLLATFLVAVAASVEAQEPTLDLDERSVTVGDAEIHYMIGGSGPPLLMVHGFVFAASCCPATLSPEHTDRSAGLVFSPGRSLA